MKWYACINEEGLRLYRDHLRIALQSCRANTGLDPHIIFHGHPDALSEALGRTDFTIHQRRTGLWDDIHKVEDKPGYRHRIAGGAFLRFEIGHIEERDEFVLYTDCDVIFQKDVDVSAFKPKALAATPDHDPKDLAVFNSGVMLMNVATARQDYQALLDAARPTLGTPEMFYDQGVYNAFYAGRWDLLPLGLNWKLYWGVNDDAAILHFHGPKLGALRKIIDDEGDAIVHEPWRVAFDNNPDAYRSFYRLALRYESELPGNAASRPGFFGRLRRRLGGG